MVAAGLPTLFRGLNVHPTKVANVRDAIARTGHLRLENGMYAGMMADPALIRTYTDQWLQSPASVRERLEKISEFPLSYGCGDISGASFYAHRGAGIPMVIEFEIPWE